MHTLDVTTLVLDQEMTIGLFYQLFGCLKLCQLVSLQGYFPDMQEAYQSSRTKALKSKYINIEVSTLYNVP